LGGRYQWERRTEPRVGEDMQALGGILVILLALALITICIAGLTDVVARRGLRHHLEPGFWASLLTGTGVVILLVVVVVLVPALLG
jgi:hypothetical protein